VSAAWTIDDPWARLPWIGPVAVLLSFMALYGFLRLTLEHPLPPPISRPVTIGIVELPAPAKAQPQPAAPPQVVAPPPPEPPKPVELQPPKPIPEPVPLAKKPVVKRPPPEKPAAAKREPEAASPPQAAAPPPPPTAAPSAPSGNDTGLAGGNMSARAIYQPMPEIPDALRHRNVELVAIARFRVGADGKAEVELVQSTPEPSLNRALLERLKAWRFFPAMASGKPVASVIEIRIPISVR
jgi:protein TonB